MTMFFKIGKVSFNSKRTVVIAEAGVNHLGKLSYAEKLIKTAKNSGADIIKFQTYKSNKLTTKKAPRFWNWEGESIKNGSQHDSYSKLDSFNKEHYKKLIKLCKKYKIEFLSTPFDMASAKMLVDLGMKGFKIASCDITNIPFLEYIGKFKLPVLLSTGASNLIEIKKAINTLEKQGTKKIGIMQCTLCYPTKPNDANLNAITTLRKKFSRYIIGFSDHTLGYDIATSSILLGVKFIEKHYTIDKNLPDSADHWLSLDPKDLNQFVKKLRTLELAMGSEVKEKKPCENLTHKYARRSIVAAMEIKKGTILKNNHLDFKRPGTGLKPEYYKKIIGKKVNRNILEDQLIKKTWLV